MTDSRIPVTVLTGFLGAGKTTLLNHWLSATPAPRLAVLENELSSLAVDTDLLVRVDEDLVETATGCLCCAARGDLPAGLMRLWPHRARFERVVIETTGLAEPGPVLLTLLADPQLAPRFVLDGVVTLLDAVHGASQLGERPEARAQVALADRLVVNKTDLATGDAVAALEGRLAGLNPHAAIRHAVRGVVPVAELGGLRPATDATGEYLPGRPAQLPLFASFQPLEKASEVGARLWWGAWHLPTDPCARLVLSPPTASGPSAGWPEAPFGHHAQDVVELDSLRLVLLPLGDTTPATIDRAAAEARGLLASADPEPDRLRPGRSLSPGQVVRLDAGQGGTWTLAIPADGSYGLFGLRDALRHHGLQLVAGEDTALPAVATFRGDATPRTHAEDLVAVGFTLPGVVDADLFEGWFGALLATRAADLPRAKGILNIAGSPRRWVFQSVHALADTLPGPAWRDDEPRLNRLVFIGRGLDEDLLREGFAGCLRQVV